MTPTEIVEFFAELIRKGTINHLQGSYQRQAAYFIRAGMIDADGKIHWDIVEGGNPDD